MEAVTKSNWEMMGHSYEQMPMHVEQDPEAMIVRSLDTLEKHTGQRPIGWLSPGFGELFNTPDVLAGAGIKYIAEWPYDDEPTRISTKHGPLVTLPYPIETQDVTTLAVQTQEAAYFARKVHGRLRPALRGKREADEVLCHCHPPVRRRTAARHQVSRGDLRAHRQVQNRQTAHFTSYFDKVQPWLAAPPERRFGTNVRPSDAAWR